MQNDQQAQLNERNAQLDQATRLSLAIFGLLGASSLILFCSFGYFMNRYLTELRLAHESTRDHKNRLEEFYAILAHELRSPITSIKGALSLMAGGMAGELTDMTRELVQLSTDEINRMLRLINELLDLKKIEEGQFELKLTTVDAQDLVAKSFNGMHWMAQEAQIRLIEQLPGKVMVRCDEDRIIQVLTNLISNAIKFSRPDSDVSVIVESGASSVKFIVKDQGQGIPEDRQHKVFQKFQQLGIAAQNDYKGTGLGLAISKSIVEVHGGTIGFDSKPGIGSTFWLTLPLASS
jgi:signal transduction histidine kinase